MPSYEPLLEDEDALIVGQCINRAFASFDPEELTTEQGVVLYMLLDRIMERLWSAHKIALFHLYKRRLMKLGFFDEIEPDDEPEVDTES